MSAAIADRLLVELQKRAEELRSGSGEVARLEAARTALGDSPPAAVAGLARDLDDRIAQLGGTRDGNELHRIHAAIAALKTPPHPRSLRRS